MLRGGQIWVLVILNPESSLYRPDWVFWETLGVIGGCMMFAAAVLFFIVLVKLIFSKASEHAQISFPAYEVLHDEPRVAILDNFRPWLIVMGALVVLAYVPAIRDIQNYSGPGAKPYDPSNPIPLELSIDSEDEKK